MIWGTSAQVGPQSGDLGRMSALDAGYDVRSSGVTIDRFCGSGISAVNLAAACIMSGAEDLVVAGGTEMMSMSARRGDGPMVMDNGNLRLRLRHPQTHQGVCADAIATLEGISRETLDELGYRQPAARPCRDPGGAFRPQPGSRLSRERRARARPRRISAAADDPRGPGLAQAGLSRASPTCRSTKAARPTAA